jgi:hypothetical protein
MLIDAMAAADLRRALLPAQDYRPFPAASDRAPWDALPARPREELVAAGERYLAFEWKALTAARFLDFKRTGNRTRYESLYFDRRTALISLVLAECVDGAGRFIDDIINGVWCVCEESFWGLPSALYLFRDKNAALPDAKEQVIDLFVAETAGLLSWIHYLLREPLDQETPQVCARIRAEIRRRLLDPLLARNDFWWMGYTEGVAVNNWNPWIHSNCLSACLFLEENPGRRVETVRKIMDSLDRFIAEYNEDGYCDEGASYWDKAGGALFDCLEQLERATGGALQFFGHPLIRRMGGFLRRSHIAGKYYANFSDCDARMHIAGSLVYRYGKRICDRAMMALGAEAFQREPCDKSENISLLREIPKLFAYGEAMAASPSIHYERDSWFPDSQAMSARQKEGSPDGLYLAAKGGHNGVSHNHNDVGQFLVYIDGLPLFVDAGIGTYTASTFGPERYKIWTMRSLYHNTPCANGVEQAAGRQYRASRVAYRNTDEAAGIAMDLAGAYPQDAGIIHWNRSISLHRRENPRVVLEEEFLLARCSPDVEIYFMSACEPAILNGESGGSKSGRSESSNGESDGGDGNSAERGGGERGGAVAFARNGEQIATLRYNGGCLACRCETLSLDDARLRNVWGEALHRVVFRAKAPVREGVWRFVLYQRGRA